jgi:hypothetical protein
MFSQHDAVHLKLRPGGEWTVFGSGPTTGEEWAKVEDYMGLFEHCELMLRGKLIDRKTFEAIFSYRLHNLLANRRIVDAKLHNEGESWTLFLSLLKRLKINPPRFTVDIDINPLLATTTSSLAASVPVTDEARVETDDSVNFHQGKLSTETAQ